MKTLFLDTYSVFVGDVNEALSEVLNKQKYSKIGFLIDENTSLHCVPLITNHIENAVPIQIESGEVNKTLRTCEIIWTQMQENKFDRHSLIINLGGGVIGDMGGFAASCYMRGIEFIQVPTSLLSQVDASVGGKLGIDFRGFKNFIGLFNDPIGVIADPSFLKTLPEDELRSGFAEMIKHALIRDAQVWSRFTGYEDWKECVSLEEIFLSIDIKRKVVKQDPFESGLRKILNFGHTIGHAVETKALGGKHHLLHGEAIAIGMIAETILSIWKTGLSQSAAKIIVDYIRSVYSDVDTIPLMEYEGIIDVISADKKNRGGRIMMSLLTDIGDCNFDIEVTTDEIQKAIEKTQEYLQ